MTVFNTFWKVVKKYKGTIILYTVMLIIFGTINISTNKNTHEFTNSKPDIFIVNEDTNIGITKNLIDYMSSNSNIVKIKKESIDDAIFYRDISYVIYIPKGYRKAILDGKDVELDIKSSGDYNASLAQMLLSRYLKVQSIYKNYIDTEDELINLINNNLSQKTNIEILSKVDTTESSNLTKYFNFASYSIMAVVIYIVCLVLTSFKENSVNKRIIISSMNYRKHNKLILLSSFVYSLIIWILYCILGSVLLKTNMFNIRGLIYVLNLFLFTFSSLTLALLISNLINNKNAVNGIVNVVALGSAFICGAFVPVQYLPENVLKFAHIFPSYWYINSNELLSSIDIINTNSLRPIFINMIVIIAFSMLFIVLNNIVSSKKRKMRKVF